MSSEIYKPSEEELALLKRWYAPDVGESVSEQRTNAFGMKVAELNQPKPIIDIADDEIEPEALSAQALQEITQQAQEQGYQEGLKKGQEEGLLQGHQEGYQQGLEQGIEEGLTQGFEQATPEIAKRIDMLEELITSFRDPLLAQQQAIEKSLLNLALTLSRKVIHCEVTQNTQPIIQAVNEGIKLIGIQQPVVLKLNPGDIDVVRDLYNEEQQEKSNLTLESDPALSVGDCVLEAVSSSVSLELEERINQVFNDFLNQPTPTGNTVESSDEDLSVDATQDTKDTLASDDLESIPEVNSKAINESADLDTNPDELSHD